VFQHEVALPSLVTLEERVHHPVNSAVGVPVVGSKVFHSVRLRWGLGDGNACNERNGERGNKNKTSIGEQREVANAPDRPCGLAVNRIP
jgi:hypothetical protein